MGLEPQLPRHFRSLSPSSGFPWFCTEFGGLPCPGSHSRSITTPAGGPGRRAPIPQVKRLRPREESRPPLPSRRRIRLGEARGPGKLPRDLKDKAATAPSPGPVKGQRLQMQPGKPRWRGAPPHADLRPPRPQVPAHGSGLRPAAGPERPSLRRPDGGEQSPEPGPAALTRRRTGRSQGRGGSQVLPPRNLHLRLSLGDVTMEMPPALHVLGQCGHAWGRFRSARHLREGSS